MLLRICLLTFITEALCLVAMLGVPSVPNTVLPQFSWQAFMTCCVTKAMPFHFIDGK